MLDRVHAVKRKKRKRPRGLQNMRRRTHITFLLFQLLDFRVELVKRRQA
jgi:hypothetical protein